jgi:hypothetical protein
MKLVVPLSLSPTRQHCSSITKTQINEEKETDEKKSFPPRSRKERTICITTEKEATKQTTNEIGSKTFPGKKVENYTERTGTTFFLTVPNEYYCGLGFTKWLSGLYQDFVTCVNNLLNYLGSSTIFLGSYQDILISQWASKGKHSDSGATKKLAELFIRNLVKICESCPSCRMPIVRSGPFHKSTTIYSCSVGSFFPF